MKLVSLSQHPVGLAAPLRSPVTRCRAAGAPTAPDAAPAAAPLKVSMVSLGCPKNTVDGEVLLGDLFRSGFEITDDHEDSDAIVVNTCAFVEDAKAESLETIIDAARLKGNGRVKKVIVTGCLAQRYSEELAEQLPEADLVVGFERYGGLAASVRQVLDAPPDIDLDEYQRRARVQVGEATVGFRPEFDRYRLTPLHTAYLRVAEGCNHACTFCSIPSFRGKFRSKPWDMVVEEARHLVAAGALELNLIAEDTNQYGQDRRDGRDLAHLLRALGEIEGLHWIRIIYAYPSYFTEDLITEIAVNPKVCKYIDMPLQHISNLTLLAMNRPPQAHTLALLHTLRDRIPDLAMRTTFISGFPGESEADHRELVDFVRSFKFQRMGAFAYSQEDKTPAADFPDQLPDEVREARRDELISLQQRIGEEWARGVVGREIEVLVDGVTEDGALFGRTQWDAPDVDNIVFINQPAEGSGVEEAEVGQLRRCKIVGHSLFDLEAVPV